MRKISLPSRQAGKSPFLVIGFIFIISLFFCAFTRQIAASTGEPSSPPVNIEFTLENTPSVGEEAVLKLTVTPLEDMHADISCLLPEGIEVGREQGVMVRPYMGMGLEEPLFHEQEQIIYTEVIELYVGLLKANITKEFTFRVIISDNQTYELIARVDALAKWGVKQKNLVINPD